MKNNLLNLKKTLLLFTFFCFVHANAQAPEQMSYQAVVRNTTNALVTNQIVGMKVSLLQGTTNGDVVYAETQTPTTNANGLISIAIGNGQAITGTFTAINWANGPFYIKTETDPTGGTNYNITGVSQILSTPYALYAKTSGSSVPGPQGPQGIPGETGATGPAGPTGPQGLEGPQGIQGEVGATGPAGETGPQGIQGIQGEVGATGPSGGETGPQGLQGPQGIQGEVGATGATGPAGETGPQGIQGIQGIQGEVGATGPAGETGPQGIQGIQGEVGATGATGPAGETGPHGLQGIQGIQGDVGATGATGPAGETGPQGTQGIQGEVGATGATGPIGATGTQGVAGPIGANGLSAYQVAVANGFAGTETQWFSSLIGAQGPQGLPGVAGINGQDGKTALINTTAEPVGTNCPNGGTKIEVGIDNNSNGVLDNNEINAAQTKYVCNGAQGVAGPQGIQGPASNSVGANAAFSDAISTYNGDISICGIYTSIAASNDGKFIVIGCQSHIGIESNGNNINSAGKVTVLKYENGMFENIGQEIIGNANNSSYGIKVGISDDGQTIFFVGGTPNNCYIYKLLNNTWVLNSTIQNIGYNSTKMNAAANLIVSLDESGNTTQSVTFYKLVGTNWISNQFFADGILADFGNSDLQISNDGSIIALSNYNQNLGVLPNPWAVANGRTGVFYYNGSTFTQKGNFIEGPNTKGWGYKICLSDDGTKIGITTSQNYVTRTSYIRTYSYDNSTSLWQQYNAELVFNNNIYNSYYSGQGSVIFIDFDSSTNYLLVANRAENPGSMSSSPLVPPIYSSNYLLMKNINNNWNQYGTSIEFKPKPQNYSYSDQLPVNFEFKSNIFFHIINGKLRIKDFN